MTDQVKDDNGMFIFSIDFQRFRKDCDFREFYELLEEKPKIALSCMSVAVHKVFDYGRFRSLADFLKSSAVLYFLICLIEKVEIKCSSDHEEKIWLMISLIVKGKQ